MAEWAATESLVDGGRIGSLGKGVDREVTGSLGKEAEAVGRKAGSLSGGGRGGSFYQSDRDFWQKLSRNYH